MYILFVDGFSMVRFMLLYMYAVLIIGIQLSENVKTIVHV